MVWEGRSREASPYPDFSAVIARLDRAIQYAAASRSIAGVSGILDAPPSRGMTVFGPPYSAASVAFSVG
ncbi:hypothetical protein FBF72_42070 [Bradyrhizobium elkanii]|nr:hypothetical protein [Bradyrhizobium elkanii]